jgi:hypothetical protein
MHLLVLVAATLAGLGVVALIAVAVQVGEEARRTMTELARLGGLRPALVDLQSSSDELRQVARALRQR